MVQIPEDAGGDTLWASGYEAYDRLSPFWKTFAEGLTATHNQVCLREYHNVKQWLNAHPHQPAYP